MSLLCGLDRLLSEPELKKRLKGQRVSLLAHPASVTQKLTHALDALMHTGEFSIVSAMGPQHGIRGDKQDNMMESTYFVDPIYHIPVFSLYGEVRRPTPEMLEGVDVILVDLQDLGCRIYTFITTLRYVLEAAAAYGKTVWVLDRPNPVGRPIEGLSLRAGWESFVGAGAFPMRHGLTMGELGQWFIQSLNLDLDYQLIKMQGWSFDEAPGFGWPLETRAWVNPSPNAPNLSMARCYPGTVFLEGTTLSEGRGTTRPLEMLGAPDLDMRRVLSLMQDLSPAWLQGACLRECWFEPTFHKHAGQLCHGLQIHVDAPHYDHSLFKPWRVIALMFKAIRELYPDYPLWRDFPYEYEYDRLAIDLINGSSLLRAWVDDPKSTIDALDHILCQDESAWAIERAPFLVY